MIHNKGICFSSFSPDLLAEGESDKARAFIRETLSVQSKNPGNQFSFVILSAALGRAMQVTSFVGLTLPSPNAAISSVLSGSFEE